MTDKSETKVKSESTRRSLNKVLRLSVQSVVSYSHVCKQFGSPKTSESDIVKYSKDNKSEQYSQYIQSILLYRIQ